MTRTAQRLAIIGTITISLLAYLFHVPNGKDVAQMNRIRLLSATMKTIKFMGRVTEMLGLSSEVMFQRNIGFILGIMKPKHEDMGLEIKDTKIEDVPVRIYRPLSSTNNKMELLPAIIYYHGGAYYLGSTDTHNAITSSLARLTGFIVISVDYRLAPEHPFPAGVDDCTIVTKHLLDKINSKKLGIDHNRIAIGGDSAGGNFAAVISMRLTMDNTQHTVPRLQMLIYPELQFFDFMLPSFVQPTLQIFHFASLNDVLHYYFNKPISESVLVNKHTNLEQKKRFRPFVDWSLIPARYRKIYKEPITDNIEGDPELVKNMRQALHPNASPLLVSNEQLAKLPPTYVLTVEHDGLRDEGLIYAARLKASGVPTVHHHFDHAFHGSLAFLNGPFALNIAHEMLNDIVTYLKANL